MLLLLALVALCWIPRAILMAEAASTAKGAWRSLLGFMEAQEKSSNRCIPCQYSEKVSVDEPDPNCYLIVLAWIPNGTGLYLNKYLWNKGEKVQIYRIS
jgi:hypothetical protein